MVTQRGLVSPGSIISPNVPQDPFFPSIYPGRLGWARIPFQPLSFTFINLIAGLPLLEKYWRVCMAQWLIHMRNFSILSPFVNNRLPLHLLPCFNIECCYCGGVMSAVCKMYLVFKVMCPLWVDWSWMQVWQLNWLNFGTSRPRECQTFCCSPPASRYAKT